MNQDTAKERSNNQKFDSGVRALLMFKDKTGHCAVPQSHPANPSLGIWVKTQRQNHRKNNLSLERMQKLNDVGFVWSLRKRKSRLHSRFQSSPNPKKPTLAIPSNPPPVTNGAIVDHADRITLRPNSQAPSVQLDARLLKYEKAAHKPKRQPDITMPDVNCEMPAFQLETLSPDRDSWPPAMRHLWPVSLLTPTSTNLISSVGRLIQINLADLQHSQLGAITQSFGSHQCNACFTFFDRIERDGLADKLGIQMGDLFIASSPRDKTMFRFGTAQELVTQMKTKKPPILNVLRCDNDNARKILHCILVNGRNYPNLPHTIHHK